jgi:hypothetical protein
VRLGRGRRAREVDAALHFRQIGDALADSVELRAELEDTFGFAAFGGPAHELL